MIYLRFISATLCIGSSFLSSISWCVCVNVVVVFKCIRQLKDVNISIWGAIMKDAVKSIYLEFLCVSFYFPWVNT